MISCFCYSNQLDLVKTDFESAHASFYFRFSDLIASQNQQSLIQNNY